MPTVNIYIYTYIYTYYIYICISISKYVYIYMYYMYKYVITCMYVYKYNFMYIYMCVLIYIYNYIYTYFRGPYVIIHIPHIQPQVVPHLQPSCHPMPSLGANPWSRQGSDRHFPSWAPSCCPAVALSRAVTKDVAGGWMLPMSRSWCRVLRFDSFNWFQLGSKMAWYSLVN